MTPREVLDRLNLCGCGSATHLDVVLFLLERASGRNEQMASFLPSFYDAAPDASERWVEFGAKVLDAAGLLEHGTGIGYSWLSPDGREFLAYLRAHGTDEEEWPEEDRGPNERSG